MTSTIHLHQSAPWSSRETRLGQEEKRSGTRNNVSSRTNPRPIISLKPKWTGSTGNVEGVCMQTQFYGALDEDLDTSIWTFTPLADMRNLEESEKRQAVPLILKGDYLSLYIDREKDARLAEI